MVPIDSSYAREDRLLWCAERDRLVPEAPGQQGRGCGWMPLSAAVSDPSLQPPSLTPLSTRLQGLSLAGEKYTPEGHSRPRFSDLEVTQETMP